MITISETENFSQWFLGLRDSLAKARIKARLRSVEMGNLGDCKPVGEGVSEMRIHCGPGYRLYFVRRGFEVLILLAGGDKGTQVKDIKTALKLARQL